MRHANIQDLFAKLLSKVQNDVEIEPILLPLQHERQITTGIYSDNANLKLIHRLSKVDIRGRGFWRNGQNSYYDVLMFNSSSAVSHSIKDKRSKSVR